MNPDAIRDKVAIVGMGCCKFGENWDKAPEDMIVEAAFEAYEDAGIDEPAEADRGGVLRRGLSVARHGRGGRLAEAVRPPDQHGAELLRDRHRRVPLRRLLDRLRAVRHRAGRRLRQAEGSRRIRAQRADAGRARTADDAGRVVLAVRGALLRDLRREPRRPRQDRGEEPSQRHAGAEVDAEEGDHRRGSAQSADHLVAVRPLRLLRAVGRRRGGDADPPRARQELPRRLRAGESGRDRARGQPAERSVLRLPALEADGLRRAAGLRTSRHLATRSRSSTSRRCTTASRSPSC